MEIKEKFLSIGWTEKPNGCWEWNGKNIDGYGYFYFKRKAVFTHRFSWTIFRGSIPSGMFVCHHCDNPICINPCHLFIGDAKLNNGDKERKGRQNYFGNAKLSPSIALQIRQEQGSCRELAKKYNIGASQVSMIKRGLAWANV